MGTFLFPSGVLCVASFWEADDSSMIIPLSRALTSIKCDVGTELPLGAEEQNRTEQLCLFNICSVLFPACHEGYKSFFALTSTIF